MRQHEQIESFIAQMPDWVSVTPEEFSQKQDELMNQACRMVSKIQAFSDDAIQEAIESYALRIREARSERVNKMGQLYILNRFLFRVPDHVEAGKRGYGGFLGVPHSEQSVNELWPLGYDSKGKLIIKYPFKGYLGEDYLAVQEFRHFRSTYKRLPKEVYRHCNMPETK